MASNTYPTRAFIKFAARNQLIADLTGQEIITFVNRNGSSDSSNIISPSESSGIGSHTCTEACETCEQLDEELFHDIATTLFNPKRNPDLYQASVSRHMATVIETRIADEIVETYKAIKTSQRDLLVLRLNALL